MKTRTILTRLALIASVPLVVGASSQGCFSDSRFNGAPAAISAQLAGTSSSTTATDDGPDHIGGVGSGQGDDTGDYVLQNTFLRAVIDQPGTDPTSPGGAFPLVNGLAPSGGTLVDLSVPGLANDEWNQMTQGLIGFRTIQQGTTAVTSATPSTATTPRSRDLVFDLATDAFVQTVLSSGGATGTASGTSNAFVDNTADFVNNGVRGGDILTILSGANANRSYVISGLRNATTLLLTVTTNTALTTEAGVSWRISRQKVASGDSITFTSGLNAGRSYRVAAIGPLSQADGGTGSSAAILIFRPAGVAFETEGTLGSGNVNYTISRRTSPLENIVVYDSAQALPGVPSRVRLTGGVLNQGAVPDGCSVAATTSRLTVGGTALTVTTDYILFPTVNYLQITTALTHPGGSTVALSGHADIVVTGGFDPPNLAPWTPLAGYAARGFDSPLIVPFVGFRGRNRPGVSYAMADQLTGQMIHVADGAAVAANLQLSTRTSLMANETISWTRNLAVGPRNDVASAADTMIQLLSQAPARVNPDTGATLPNMFRDPIEVRGFVLGAPAGTVVTALQVTPGLIFDAGVPNGLTTGPGFYPSTIVGAQERILTSAAVVSEGFSFFVPSTFAGRAPNATANPDLFVTSPYENGANETTYRILVEAPGHDPQSVIVKIPRDAVNNLQFDLRQETGTLDIVVQDEAGNPTSCTVLVRGVDPDGAGPAPTTPNPTFGGVVSSTTGQGTSSVDAYADGGGDNVLHLLDGTAQVQVAPGHYQVVASRGLEYSLGRFPAPGSAQEFVRVTSGQTTRTVNAQGEGIRLVRLLDSASLAFVGSGTTFTSPLRRLVGADLRGHTGASFDVPTPARDMLIQAMATGLEVFVNTERDNLLDLSAVLTDLDAETSQALTGVLRVQSGVELSPFVPVNVANVAVFPNTAGSWSGWPLSVQATRRRNGAPADEFRNPAILMDILRNGGASLVQLNLPRAPIAEPPLPALGPGFFTNGKSGFVQVNTGNSALAAGGYATPLRSNSTGSSTNDGSLDDLNASRSPSTSRYNSFDLIELYAGNSTLYDITRTDFYALTSAGYVRTATGNAAVTSTTGYPRTYVRTSGDGSADLAGLSLSDFNSALRPSLVQATPGTTAPSLGNFFPATRRSGAGADDMEVLVSSGPVVYIEVDADEDGTFEGQPGDLVTDDGDLSVDVRITVIAPPWVPVSEAKLIVNGGTPSINGTAVQPATGFGFQEVSITGTDFFSPSGSEIEFSTDLGNVVRVRTVRTVSLRNPPTFAVPSGSAGDHWILGEARGTVTSGSLFDQLVPSLGGPAIGFTNPIFIDVNNDGEFDPPGVP